MILKQFIFDTQTDTIKTDEYMKIRYFIKHPHDNHESDYSLIEPRYYDLVMNIYPRARPMVTGEYSLDPVAFYDDNVLIAVIMPVRK
jgi:hypothetical protein